jgi:hypothetical protein
MPVIFTPGTSARSDGTSILDCVLTTCQNPPIAWLSVPESYARNSKPERRTTRGPFACLATKRRRQCRAATTIAFPQHRQPAVAHYLSEQSSTKAATPAAKKSLYGAR